MRTQIIKFKILALSLLSLSTAPTAAFSQAAMVMPPDPAPAVAGEVPDGLRMMGASDTPHALPEKMAPMPSTASESEKFSDSPTGLPEARAMEIVEVADGALITLTAAPARQKVDGTWIRRLAYNGSIPGPIIKVKQGAKIRLVIANKMDVETTLHPHGLRIDEKNDGVVGIGQAAIEPGRSHEYALAFPDAGIFWYHAHVHEDYTQDAGLYGNFWVEPTDKNFYNAVHREVPLLLDDVQSGPAAEPYFRERSTHTLTGRFGNSMLINGATDFTLSATQGEVVRLFLTNVANTRTFAFHIPGLRLKLVGGDNGLYEHETWVESVTIGPSERVIVEVQFAERGTFEIVNQKPVGSPTRLGKIEVRAGAARKLPNPFETLRSPDATAAAFRDVKPKLGIAVTHELRLDVSTTQASMPMAPSIKGSGPDTTVERAKEGGIEWEDGMASMNAASDDKNVVWKLVDDATKLENMDIKWTFKKGDFVKVRLFNDPKSDHPMQHPIHFHGQRFVIAAVNGVPVRNLVWKDTVLVPEGDKVDIVLELSNVGRWLAHCHIAEHLSAGMAMGFTVLNDSQPAATGH